LRELAGDVRDSYAGMLLQITNDTMKVLAIIATATLPLVLLSGVWGMNAWVREHGGPVTA